MRRWTILVVSGALLFTGGAAGANGFEAEPAMAPSRPAPAAPEPRSWYGWQIVLSSGLGAAGLVGTLTLALPHQWQTPALGLYLAGGPIVHAANGRSDRILGSLALELGVPLAGTGAWFLGMMAESPCDGGLPHPSEEQRMGGACRLGPALLLGSIVAGPLIDAFGRGWKTEARPPTTGLRLAPFVAPLAAGGLAGVNGRF